MVNSKNQWSAVELGKNKVKSKTMLLSVSNIVISNIATHIISISFWIITDIFVISNYLHLKKKVFKIYALFNVKKNGYCLRCLSLTIFMKYFFQNTYNISVLLLLLLLLLFYLSKCTQKYKITENTLNSAR